MFVSLLLVVLLLFFLVPFFPPLFSAVFESNDLLRRPFRVFSLQTWRVLRAHRAHVSADCVDSGVIPGKTREPAVGHPGAPAARINALATIAFSGRVTSIHVLFDL